MVAEASGSAYSRQVYKAVHSWHRQRLGNQHK